MIMSPAGPIRNVPYTATSGGGPVEEDSDEREGTAKSGGAGTSEEWSAEAGRCGEDVGSELSAGGETEAGRPGRRCQGAAASKCREKFESCEVPEIPAGGVAADPGEVFGNGTGAIWTHASGRASSGRGWTGGQRGDVATMDVGGGIVGAKTSTESAPEEARTAGTFWGLGADGREFSSVVGGAWTAGMFDEHGG